MAASSQLRREFWRAFRDYMAGVSAIGCSSPSSDGWMWHVAHVSSGYLASLLNVRLGQIGVRFRLAGPEADTVFSFLESHRHDVDDALEPRPTWRRGEGSSHVIEVLTGADVSARDSWPAHMSWLRTELEAFQAALWPHVGRVPPAAGRRHWNEELFLSELSAWNPGCLVPATAILATAQQRVEAIQWGSGGRTGSFTPTVWHGGIPHQLVSVRTDGTFQLLFSRLRETPPFADRAGRLELLRRVNEVRHLRLGEEVLGQRPGLPLAMLGDAEVRAQFTGLLGWFSAAVTRGG
jgi:hypothetical protein